MSAREATVAFCAQVSFVGGMKNYSSLSLNTLLACVRKNPNFIEYFGTKQNKN